MDIYDETTIEALKIGVASIYMAHQQMERWQKTFDEMFNGHFVPTFNDILEIALIDVLQEMYNDTDTLGWWIYEMEFGTKAKKGSMNDENGNDIPMHTIDDLYKYYEKYTLNQKRKKKSDISEHYRSMDKMYKILEEAMLKKGKINGKS